MTTAKGFDAAQPAPDSKYLTTALDLAAMGFRVFPLKPGTKLPGIKKWPELATNTCTDPNTPSTTEITNKLAQIRKWWSGYYSMANIGIATGDDIFIIDVDMPKALPAEHTDEQAAQYAHQLAQALDSLDRLKELGLPPTYSVKTPTGGLHLYYRTPTSTGGSSGEPVAIKTCSGWMPQIDIRGHGGQGVGPGSLIAGKQVPYEVLHNHPIADIPKEIVDLLPKREQGAAMADVPEYLKSSAKLAHTDSLVTDNGANQYSEFPDSIPLGKHDETLFKYACSWRTRGITRSQAVVLMQELVTRLEFDASEGDPLRAGMAKGLEKLEHAYTSYPNQPKPEETWTQVVSAGGEEVQVRRRELADMKAAIERFVFVESGNRVADLERSPLHAVLALEEFKNSYRNVYVGDKQLPAQWLGNIHRQTVRDVTWIPRPKAIVEEDGEQFFNQFMPGQLPAQVNPEMAQPFMAHLQYLFPKREDAVVFMNWLAATIQTPWVRVQWMPLIISDPGVGKGFLYQTLQRLLGHHNTAMISHDDLDPKKGGGFNAFMDQTLLVCIDELYTRDRWELMNQLNTTITEKTLEINRKYGKKGQTKVYSNLIAFSNHDDAAALRPDDRRIWVHRVHAPKNSPEYYRALFNWLDGDGPGALYDLLMRVDISQFEPGAPPPVTQAKQRMIAASRSNVEVVLHDAITDREGPFQYDIIDHNIAEAWVSNAINEDKLSIMTKRLIQKVLTNLGPELPQERYRVSLDPNSPGKRYRLRAIRNFDQWSTGELYPPDEFVNALRVHLGQKPAQPPIVKQLDVVKK